MAVNCVKVFAEFKRTLSSLNVTVTNSCAFEDSVFVEVLNSEIALYKDEKELHCRFGDLQLSPLSCRGLRLLRNKGIQFTVHLQGSDMDSITPDTKQSKSTEFVDRVQLYQDKCYCVNCGQKILADHCRFSRVLPLPSENWSDFSDIWFCHKHNGEEDSDNHQHEVSLIPKSHECFVGETYLLIQSSRVKLGHTKLVQDTLQCGRCASKLGHVFEKNDTDLKDVTQNGRDGTVYKLYRHSVIFHSVEFEQVNSLSSLSVQSEDFFAHLILEQSHLYTCFRLLLGAETDSRKIHCLIWLIDPSLTIFSGEESSSKILHLKPQKVLKILYKCYLGLSENRADLDKDMLQYWIKDIAVHSFQLPYQMALQLITCLISNTKSMPRSQRYVNRFHTGFLKYLPDPS